MEAAPYTNIRHTILDNALRSCGHVYTIDAQAPYRGDRQC